MRKFDTYKKAANDFLQGRACASSEARVRRTYERTVKEIAEEFSKKQGAYERNLLVGWKVHIEKYIVPLVRRPTRSRPGR